MPATTAPHWFVRGLTALALIILIALAYHAAPENGFHFDDESNIVRHGPVHMTEFSVERLTLAATEGRLPQRVIPNVSFALDWWRGDGYPRSFQFTNIAIHSATALATLAFLFLILQRARIPPTIAWTSAAIATAAWALHPIQVQAVTYIVQRMAALAALFIILAVWSYVKGRTSTHSLRWFAFCAVTSLAACLSKENAAVLPVLILLAEYGLCRPDLPRIRTALDRALLATPLLILTYLALDLALLQGPVWQFVDRGFAQREFTLLERLLTQPRVFFFHVGQILLPLPERFSIDHDIALSRNLFDPWTTLPAHVGVALWIATGGWLLLRTRHHILAFLMLWVPVTLSIESSFIPLEMIFEHRMYLPSVALAGGLALAIATSIKAGWYRPVTTSAVVIVAALLWATIDRVPTWKTSVTLYEHAARTAPGSARVWTNLGTAYEGENRSQEAVHAYDTAIRLAPQRAIAYLNRGSSHRRIGNTAAAEADYTRFMALKPADFRGPYALGSLLLAEKRHHEAETMLLNAARLEPQSPLPHRDLAEVFLQTARPYEALIALEHARERDPAIVNANYYETFGVAHARLGRFELAADAFTNALSIDPKRTETRVNLGYALLRGERFSEAIVEFDHVLANASTHPRALSGRAESLARLGRLEEAAYAAQQALAADPNSSRSRQLLRELSKDTPN